MSLEGKLRLELEGVGGSLDAAGVPWAVAAGAAVYLYAGNRPPTDLDLLIPPERLELAAAALSVAPKREAVPWGEVSKILLGETEVVASLIIDVDGGTCEYRMDDEMIGRIRRLRFQGLQVPVLAPEELIALKALLQRGPEQGKHDLEDIDALARAMPVDREYLLARLRRMGGEERARPVLERWKWA